MKKQITVLVALGLMVSVLAGCGQTSKESNVQKSSDTKVESSVANTASGESAQQEEESKYPDYLNLESAKPIVKEGEKVTLKMMVMRDAAATTPVDEVWLTKYIEEKLNIDLELEMVTSDNVDERKSLMLMSGDMPDMTLGVSFTNSEIMMYGVDQQLLLPVSDYMSEELTPNLVYAEEKYPGEFAKFEAPDGKDYTIPRLYINSPGQGNTLGSIRMFVDVNYLKAAGYTEVPDTMDGFLEMLRAFKKLDPKTMGVEEIWPMLAISSLDRKLIQNAFGWVSTSNTNMLTPTWDADENAVVVPALQEKYGEYLAFYNTLYTEGLIHPDYFTMDSTATQALQKSRAAGVIGVWAPSSTIPEAYDEYVSCIPLKSDYTETGIATEEAGSAAGLVFISADTEYPEVCMRLLDWYYSPEGAAYCHLGPVDGSEDALGYTGFKIEKNDAGATVMVTSHIPEGYETWAKYRLDQLRLNDFVPFQERREEFTTSLGVDPDKYNATLGEEQEPGVVINTLTGKQCTGDPSYRYYVYHACEGKLVAPLPGVFMDADTTAEFTDLQTVLKDHVDTESAKFITGRRPLSELNDFFAELKAMGSEDYLKLVQEVYAYYEGPSAQ